MGEVFSLASAPRNYGAGYAADLYDYDWPPLAALTFPTKPFLPLQPREHFTALNRRTLASRESSTAAAATFQNGCQMDGSAVISSTSEGSAFMPPHPKPKLKINGPTCCATKVGG